MERNRSHFVPEAEEQLLLKSNLTVLWWPDHSSTQIIQNFAQENTPQRKVPLTSTSSLLRHFHIVFLIYHIFNVTQGPTLKINLFYVFTINHALCQVLCIDRYMAKGATCMVHNSFFWERREENFVFVETASNVRDQDFSSFMRICTTEFINFCFWGWQISGEYVYDGISRWSLKVQGSLLT